MRREPERVRMWPGRSAGSSRYLSSLFILLFYSILPGRSACSARYPIILISQYVIPICLIILFYSAGGASPPPSLPPPLPQFRLHLSLCIQFSIGIRRNIVDNPTLINRGMFFVIVNWCQYQLSMPRSWNLLDRYFRYA